MPLSPGSSRAPFPFWVVALAMVSGGPPAERGLPAVHLSKCHPQRPLHNATTWWSLIFLGPLGTSNSPAGLRLPLPMWLVTSGVKQSGPFQALALCSPQGYGQNWDSVWSLQGLQ